MWSKSSAVCASTDGDYTTTTPFTKPKVTKSQRFRDWVREHPWTSALLAVLLVGCIVAVIVGPVVGLQDKDKTSDQAEAPSEQTSDFKLIFQASNAPNLCTQLSDPAALSSYASNLRSSISSLLGIQADQVAVRSLQCGSQSFEVSAGTGVAGSRRMLRSTNANSADESADSLSLVLIFRLLASAAPSTQGAPAPAGTSLSAVTSLLQSDSVRTALERAISEVLGLPQNSVTLVRVDHDQVPLLPPSVVSSPMPPPLLVLQPHPSPPLVLAAPPPVPSYGGFSGGSTPMPPTYSPFAQGPQSPPVYGSGQHLPPAPPVYLLQE